MTRKRILLTGAAGRVGRLVRPLLQANYALRLCDVQPLVSATPDDEIHHCDLAEPGCAQRAVEGVAAVVHLAGLVAPAVSFAETVAANYHAVLNLLEACRHHGVPRFVFASSHHIMGLHPPTEVSAAAPLAPDGFYGLSKAFGEAACALYSRRFGLRVFIVRIGNADMHVADGRRERLWVSGRDLAQLITIGLEHPDVKCATVYGTSDCPDPFFSQDEARRFGYQPLDRASEHLAPDFRPLSSMNEADGVHYVGGPFAVSALPGPFRPT